jgi:hypothetical protein
VIAMFVFSAEKPDFDPNSVTPGWVGFAITFLIAAAVVLLVIDMIRRVRRTQYRGEIRERLETERTDAAAGAPAESADQTRPDAATGDNRRDV